MLQPRNTAAWGYIDIDNKGIYILYVYNKGMSIVCIYSIYGDIYIVTMQKSTCLERVFAG